MPVIEMWAPVRSFIETVLKTVESQLDSESVEAVWHYLNHGEYEMAFEGLFIEIMKLERAPKIDFKKSKEIAEELKLNEESVFEFNFWDTFEQYIQDHQLAGDNG